MVRTVSGLLQAVNHDYTIWIVGATLLVFGLYWVSAKYTLEKATRLTVTVVDVDRHS